MVYINDSILFQRDYRIDENISILEYARKNAKDINAHDAIAVVAKDGVLFELNLSGAIIFEGILSRESKESIINKMLSVFNMDLEHANISYDIFIEDLLKKGILR